MIFDNGRERGVVREERGNIVFVGVPTNETERALLRDCGFVHITGVLVRGRKRTYLIGELLYPHELGTWGMERGKVVIITHGGEVWLAPYRDGQYSYARMILRITGNATAFVPLVHREDEDVANSEILQRRAADPSYGLIVRRAMEGGAA